MPVTIKVTHTPSATTRKLLVEPPSTYESLVQLVLSRFQLQGPAELVYTDEDGDLITLSSDEELQELFATAQEHKQPVRFDLRQGPSAMRPAEKEVSLPATKLSVSSSSSSQNQQVSPEEAIQEHGNKEEEKEEDWTSVRATESSTPRAASPSAEGPSDPTTPTLLFEDPDETPLPSTSDLAREQAAKEFPPSSASSTISSHPGAFPDDPLDLPLPSSSGDDLPFSNLPNSLSSFLASLGTRSSTFSSTLASALSPTSPHSPTSRLSSILSASSLDDIPLVASSLVQMGSEFAEIAKDVAMGVRREADEIRGEFSRLREEVERERDRFRDEIREAVSQASTPRAQDEDIELDQVPATTGDSPPPPPIYVPSSTRSSVAPSSVSPSTSSHPQPNSASSPPPAPTVSRETSRLLQKQAKQARKDYRAAVRQAREEKKRSRSQRSSVAGEQQQGPSTAGYHIPGEMPSSSSV